MERQKELGFAQQCAVSMQILPLSIIVGGIVALGIISAPIVFKSLAVSVAGPLMAEIFTRFETVLVALWVFFSIGVSFEIVVRQRLGTLLKSPNPLTHPLLRLTFYSLLTVAIFYSTYFVSPEIRALQHEGIHRLSNSVQGQHFDQLHHLSESLYKAMLMLAMMLLGALPFSFTIETTSDLELPQSRIVQKAQA
jgi:Domain of unknown function (DUF4149)